MMDLEQSKDFIHSQQLAVRGMVRCIGRGMVKSIGKKFGTYK